MPFQISPHLGLVLVRYSGNVSATEFQKSLTQVHEHPAFEHFNCRINDMVGVTHIDIADPHLDDLTALIHGAAQSRRNPSLQRFVAYVIQDAAVADRVRRFVAAIDSPYETEFFSTLAEAARWASARTGRQIDLT